MSPYLVRKPPSVWLPEASEADSALAYTDARKHARNSSFTFGTGKFGDLAGFSSAIILARIAILICYEAVSRLFAPVAIHFREAVPIACLGLAVTSRARGY